jgi:hypothetical protein
MSEVESDPGSLFANYVGKLPDRAMRLFAVECCRRVCQFLTDHWRYGVDVAERFAEGQADRDELVFRLGYLTRDFEEVVESDNGEIYAAKQAVLACLDPSSPFDPTEAAAKASKSVGCAHDTEEARHEEQLWQAVEFQAYIAGAV